MKEAEASLKPIELHHKYRISEATCKNYNAKFGGVTVTDRPHIREREQEVKHLFAEPMLDNAALMDLLARG